MRYSQLQLWTVKPATPTTEERRPSQAESQPAEGGSLQQLVKQEKDKPTAAANVRERHQALVRAALASGRAEQVLPFEKARALDRLFREGQLEEAARTVRELILAHVEGLQEQERVTQQEFSIINPTSQAKLWATVFFPADAKENKRYPAVVFIPGGLGFGSGLARSPQPNMLVRAGFVVGYFDPDGRGRSEGQEDYNGKVHQDGLHAFLKHVAGMAQVQQDNIGVFSSSLGLALAAGALGRYPDDPPVKYFIDDEGPSDRFYITKNDDPRFARIFPRGTQDEEWWAEREAVRSIQNIRCAYLRIQRQRDHVHGESKQHALDMINAATHTKFDGKGRSPWTRINGADNQPNQVYTKDGPPKWLPARAGLPLPEETLRWLREMAALPAPPSVRPESALNKESKP